MKCQKCGKNEVNFHYSSNVNGCVTEMHLCSKCAIESGYDIGQMLDLGNIFDGMLPLRGGIGGFMPLAIPVMQNNAIVPVAIHPRIGMIEQGNPCDCGCGKNTAQVTNTEIDEEMSKRRELNMQMRAAIESEEFEKAALLRDKIKELEAAGLHSKPDKLDAQAEGE